MNWYMEKDGAQRISLEDGERLLEACVAKDKDNRWTAWVLILIGRRPDRRSPLRKKIHGKAAVNELQQFDTEREAVKWAEDIWTREQQIL